MLKYYIVLLLFSCVNCKNKTFFNISDYPSCKRENKSCSGFFNKHVPLEFCQQISFGPNNNTICNTLYNKTIINDNKNIDLGTLILKPIYDKIDKRTVFNITFVDIKFQKLFIFFQEYINISHISDDKCNVRDFSFNGSVKNDSFSYVCPWSLVDFERHEVEFHYQYGREEYETLRKCRFKVPEHAVLENKSLKYFIYVDFTDRSNLILNIVPLFDFNITNFNITVFYKFGNVTTEKSSLNISGYSFNYKTDSNEGEYIKFRVEPISENCDDIICKAQESVLIKIVEPEVESSSMLIIGMVGVSILIPVFMIIIYMWTGKCPYKLKESPNVLLVTVPTNDAHFYVAPAFANFLNELNINTFLDVNEHIRDHTDWLKVHLDKATHIIYLRSREDISDIKIIHKKLYEATVFFHEPQHCSKKRECIINFPYSVRNYPEKLAHINQAHIFEFKKDLNKIIEFLIGKKIIGDLKNNNDSYDCLMRQINFVQNLTPMEKRRDILENYTIVNTDNNDDFDYETNENIPDLPENEMGITGDNISISHVNLSGEQQNINEELISIISNSEGSEFDYNLG